MSEPPIRLSGSPVVEYPWQLPLGATAHGDESCLRVWAPNAARVEVRHAGGVCELEELGMGIWEGRAPLAAGQDYWYVVCERGRGVEQRVNDPCSRHQPRGIRGPSRVFDPSAHRWSDQTFRAPALAKGVLYELHVGTFSPEGTFDGVQAQLPRLAELGVSAIELMPVAEFPGKRGWGYDGVHISAAHHCYGGPSALQRLVDGAHRHGIAVILDVVYNHVGASGVRAMERLGPYFTDRYHGPWGKAINFDDENSDPVREWVMQSAESWICDFHIDGLRLDAVHAIHDQSAKHIVAELAERVHARNPAAVVIAESALNDARVIRPRELGGYGCDAQWADDFHHALRALITPEKEGYYADFGKVADFAKAYHRPYVHDGNYSGFRRKRFGAPAEDRPAQQFVVFSQNHDQIGNRAFGDRLPPRARRLAAFSTLLSPFVALLFMGEEYGEEAPFQFFTDHIDRGIARATREGRRREFAAFASFAEDIPDPQEESTFQRSKLGGSRDPELAAIYRELIAQRRQLRGETSVLGLQERARWLHLRRGEHELVFNFADRPRTIHTDRIEVVLATHEALLAAGAVTLPGLSGVLLR